MILRLKASVSFWQPVTKRKQTRQKLIIGRLLLHTFCTVFMDALRTEGIVLAGKSSQNTARVDLLSAKP